jgi:hypothetical protein
VRNFLPKTRKRRLTLLGLLLLIPVVAVSAYTMLFTQVTPAVQTTPANLTAYCTTLQTPNTTPIAISGNIEFQCPVDATHNGQVFNVLASQSFLVYWSGTGANGITAAYLVTTATNCPASGSVNLGGTFPGLTLTNDTAIAERPYSFVN